MADKNEKEEFLKKHPNVIARETPNSYEAESALLGCFLIDGSMAAKYIPQLCSDDFYTPGHRLLFEAMRDLFASSKPVDIVTVVQRLDASGNLAATGGVEYISGLVNAIPSIANAEHYYGIIKKTAQLRAMIEIAKTMADEAYALDPEDNALSHAEAALYSLAETGRRGRLEPITGFITDAMQDLRQRQENRDAYRGVPTGFSSFDTLLGGGFQRSDLIVLAARPGQGKTSFAMNCAVNAALSKRPDTKENYSVAVFSLEMSAIQLAKRILCSVGNFDMSLANRANIDEMGWAKLYGAQARFAGTKLYVDESGDATPAEILSKCRQLKHSVGLDFVMIDYLQLMQSGKRLDNIVREIAEITRSLKLAAKELDVPILLLSQMSRDIDKRKDPTPQLSDLRDSGAIEQDADIVLFLDRTAKTQDVEDPATDASEVIAGNTVYLNVAKHRNGETGSVRLVWVPSTVTFKSVRNANVEPRPGSGKNAGDAGFPGTVTPKNAAATKKTAVDDSVEFIDGSNIGLG